MVEHNIMKYKSPKIHRTPLYRAKAAYLGMLKRCLNANGKNPTYSCVELRMTLEEFLEWSLPRYAEFISEFPNTVPNVARYNDKGHYEIGNIEIISRLENQQQTTYKAAIEGYKTCSKCNINKSIDSFVKHKGKPDGLSYECRECKRLYYLLRKK